MQKQFFNNHLIAAHACQNVDSLIQAQTQQAWARMLFAIASLVYLSQHAIFFGQFSLLFLPVSLVYFLYNALSISFIRRTPLSTFRTFFASVFDIFVVSFGMLIDGGHSSGIYFLFLIIIIGNSFRYGNTMMIYTQALSFIGLISMSVYATLYMQLELDRTLLIWQLAGLVAIPYYVYLIGKKAEKAMQRQAAAEEASIHLLDQGPLPVFTYNLDDHNQPRILYANQAIEDMLLDKHETLIGKGPDVLVLAEDSEEMLNFCHSVLALQQKGNQSVRSNVYIRGRDKSGKILRLMLSASHLQWRESWIGVCFMLDITKRETLQEQLDAMHRQGFMSTLVAGIVHDFRNVLTNMIGYAEVMKMSSSDDTSKKRLSAIIDAGERGSTLVTHLLKLSKNKTSDISDQFTEGDKLEKPLENIIGLSRLQLPAHVQLHYKIHTPLHDVAISTIEIEQILLNLINNSTQAIKGAGHIHIDIGNDFDHPVATAEQPAFYMKVVDDGVGISDENIGKIFNPFWTTHGESKGSGLGLTMVQRIIKLRRGSIHVESSPNQGSCFTIHLPPYTETKTEKIEPASSMPVTVSSAADQTASVDQTAYHILLVDDASGILDIHKAMLARMRHTAEMAENGKQALELFLKNKAHFDMIITDYRMPEMNGLELVEAVRQHDKDIPILMITAFGEDENLQRAGSLGVQVMNKPVTLEKLKKAVAEIQQAATRRHLARTCQTNPEPHVETPVES